MVSAHVFLLWELSLEKMLVPVLPRGLAIAALALQVVVPRPQSPLLAVFPSQVPTMTAYWNNFSEI